MDITLTTFCKFQGQEVKKKIGASIYLECSAKTGEGVEEAFQEAVRLLLIISDAKKKERRERRRFF
jgi:Ras family protein A